MRRKLPPPEFLPVLAELFSDLSVGKGWLYAVLPPSAAPITEDPPRGVRYIRRHEWERL